MVEAITVKCAKVKLDILAKTNIFIHGPNMDSATPRSLNHHSITMVK